MIIVHGTVNIEDAFPLAFSISNYFLCTFGASTIPVFRPNRFEDWVIFGSHSRDSDGLSSPHGAASFIYFTNYDNFLCFIAENYLGLQSEITPLIFDISVDTDQVVTNQNLNTCNEY